MLAELRRLAFFCRGCLPALQGGSGGRQAGESLPRAQRRGPGMAYGMPGYGGDIPQSAGIDLAAS